MNVRNAVIVGLILDLIAAAALLSAPAGGILAISAGAGMSVGTALIALAVMMSRWQAEARRISGDEILVAPGAPAAVAARDDERAIAG